MKEVEDVRLLTLEDRVNLALMYYNIPGFSELCNPPIEKCVAESTRLYEVEHLLDQYKVPTMSTELSEEQKEALITGVKPDPTKPRIHLNYRGVLSDADGKRLEELFNLGEFTQLGQKTNRPLSTYRLTVPEKYADELLEIHEKWLINRICILLDGPKGLYWLTPDTAHRKTNVQHYVAVPSLLTDRLSMPIDHRTRTGETWRDALEDLVERRPDLGFVQLMLQHFLQPAHVQLLHNAQLNEKALLMEYQGTTYRVIGVTPQGTLMLTTKLKQGLVYDSTLPFRDVVDTATWTFWDPH